MIKAIARMLFLVTALAFACTIAVPTFIAPAYSYLNRETKALKKVYPHIFPMRDIVGRSFCTSFAVEYKREVFTVTNAHCCESFAAFNVEKDSQLYIQADGALRKVLALSPKYDSCILESTRKRGIKLSKKEVNLYSKAFTLGYPYGRGPVPRFGHIIRTYANTTVEGHTVHAIHTTVFAQPGHSGSPLLDSNGNLIGIIYAGNSHLMLGIAIHVKDLKKVLKKAYIVKDIDE